MLHTGNYNVYRLTHGDKHNPVDWQITNIEIADTWRTDDF